MTGGATGIGSAIADSDRRSVLALHSREEAKRGRFAYAARLDYGSRIFRTSRFHFPRRSACRKSHAANAETCLVHARAFGVERVAGPPHGLHYALIARGSFCGHEPKDVVHMQKNVDPFRESRAMVHPGAQELPGPPNENKEKKKENT